MNRLLLKIAVITFCICTLFSVGISAQEIISLDDENYQEFNGKTGRWVFTPSRQTYLNYIKEFGSSENEVADLNPGAPKILNKYIFFTYSQEYIKKLEEKNIFRKNISSEPDQFIWPVDAVRISSVLGFRGKEFHTGVDIPSPKGTPVRAAMEGEVVFNGYSGGYGNMIDIQHRNGFVTRYGHNTALVVKKGDFVKKGQIIAFVGSTGRSTGNHVHFEMLCNSIPLDPLDFLPDSSKLQIVQQLKNWKSK